MSVRVEITLCVCLAVLFGALSFSAIRGKSPTFDEPAHFGSAYAHVYLHDDRTDCEHPVLWKCWPMLFVHRGDVKVDLHDPGWRNADDYFYPRPWPVTALFSPRAEPGMALINRGRFAMMLLGVILCLATAWFAHQIAGAWAAIAACFMLALDPTCLAHASIIKNDVPMSLVMLLAMLATFRAGRRMTVWNALSLLLACAVSVVVKNSGALIEMICILTLLVRACMPTSWTILGKPLVTRARKIASVVVIAALMGCLTFAVIWASYGFRFAPSDDPQLGFHQAVPFRGGVDYVLRFAREHRLLPEAYCVGALRQHSMLTNSPNFLLGEIHSGGWWYYFPFAFVVKTPLASLVAITLTIISVPALRKRQRQPGDAWPAICVGLPLAIYLFAATQEDMQHGIRHLLPVFPFVFVAVGWAFARAIAVFPRAAALIGAGLAIGLAAETLSAYPNFIPFFNLAAGGSRGGLALLSDSNLDWGQDLTLLAQWQREHPHVKLYATTFGVVDPAGFGIDYVPLPGYYLDVDTPPDPRQPGVLAISATILQGVYVHSPWDAMYAELRTWKPREILGGSIYLYDYPPPAMSRLDTTDNATVK